MDLLSIAEATKLTRRHEKAIRRWIKRQLDSDPQAKVKIVQEAIASGFSYRIDKDYLLTHSPTPLGSPPIQGGVQSPGQDTEQDTRQHVYPSSPLIVAKDETITLLKEQIRQQQEELNKKTSS